MATSAQGVSQAPVVAGYDTPVSYNDWIASVGSGKDPYNGAYKNESASTESVFNGDNFLGWIGSLLGTKKAYKGQYDAYVQAINKQNELRALANARAYDEWFESTKYQRAVEDLKKAGLNPWLALNSGFANQSSASTTNSSAKGVEFEMKQDKNGLSALFSAIAKLIAS